MIPSPRQPVLPPSASSIVAEVNFAVTRSGLEGQLLGVTLQFEQPELEKQKSEQLRREEEVRPSRYAPFQALLHFPLRFYGAVTHPRSLLCVVWAPCDAAVLL